jgi:hypothetical protein
VSVAEVEFVGIIETAVAERAPTLDLPRKRERERSAFGVSSTLSIGRGEPPLPLAGKRRALSVPSSLVGEGQGGG